jgi:hypothetical protein
MSDQKIRRTNIDNWKPSTCPFCGEGDGGANGDRMLARGTLGYREIILGVHEKCFAEIFAAQEAQRRAI